MPEERPQIECIGMCVHVVSSPCSVKRLKFGILCELAVNWTTSFSKYLRFLEPFFDSYDPEFVGLRQKMSDILQQVRRACNVEVHGHLTFCLMYTPVYLQRAVGSLRFI